MKHKLQAVKRNKSANLENRGTALVYVIGIIFLLFFCVVFLSFLFELLFRGPNMMRFHFRPNIEFLENFAIFSAFLNTINAFLLAYLINNYVSLYLHLKSKFALGLIIIASALFAQSISANPIVAYLVGFRGFGLGPFALIPSIFTFVAAVVLVYLSRQ